LALNRELNGQTSSADAGNWQLPLFQSRLSHDQTEIRDSGSLAPWQTGARLWLQLPASLSQPQAPLQALRFSLATETVDLGHGLQSLRPVFNGPAGWRLDALNPSSDRPVALQALGHSLYDQATGLPWQAAGYRLTGPDGTQYQLAADGRIERVVFSDGVQWLLSDAGIAVVGRTDRLDCLRDAQGRLSRVSGPTAQGSQSLAYRYDAQGRLMLVRPLGSEDIGQRYGYDQNGQLLTQAITADLGAAVHWQGATPRNRWQGQLSNGTSTYLSFSVRQSELDASVKTPGAQGAVILAIDSQGAEIDALGATVIGRSGHTTLIRVTEAGLKLLQLTGKGDAQVTIRLAGDLNRDGAVDGTD
ncbi:hypothetical protein, partial [Parachitinimonas caeni]